MRCVRKNLQPFWKKWKTTEKIL